MKRLLLRPCILGVSTLSLSGCMAMGMCGMEHGAAHQEQHASKAVFEEAHLGDVTVSLEVPPLSVGIESTLSVKVSHISSGEPVSGAKVTVAVSQLTPPAGHHPATLFEGRAEEGTTRGTYSVKHAFAEQGPHDIVARVWVDGGDKSATPVTVAATQEVHQHKDSKGRMDVMPMGILYGAGMGLLMALMMGRFLF
ncbi:MAG: FixH family protein [Candidatus Latescibacteria bacterium]|nr:FixH family protein [Candidatus Latescibacterota bacterium]